MAQRPLVRTQTSDLLGWVQSRVNSYKDVKVTNFTKCWADGLAFCALVHSWKPDQIDYSTCSIQKPLENLNKAFNVLEKFGIKLLDAEDTIEVQDSKSIMAQVMMIQKEIHSTNAVLLPTRLSTSFQNPPLGASSQNARTPQQPTASPAPALQRGPSASDLLRAQKAQQEATKPKVPTNSVLQKAMAASEARKHGNTPVEAPKPVPIPIPIPIQEPKKDNKLEAIQEQPLSPRSKAQARAKPVEAAKPDILKPSELRKQESARLAAAEKKAAPKPEPVKVEPIKPKPTESKAEATKTTDSPSKPTSPRASEPKPASLASSGKSHSTKPSISKSKAEPEPVKPEETPKSPRGHKSSEGRRKSVDVKADVVASKDTKSADKHSDKHSEKPDKHKSSSGDLTKSHGVSKSTPTPRDGKSALAKSDSKHSKSTNATPDDTPKSPRSHSHSRTSDASSRPKSPSKSEPTAREPEIKPSGGHDALKSSKHSSHSKSKEHVSSKSITKTSDAEDPKKAPELQRSASKHRSRSNSVTDTKPKSDSKSDSKKSDGERSSREPTRESHHKSRSHSKKRHGSESESASESESGSISESASRESRSSRSSSRTRSKSKKPEKADHQYLFSARNEVPEASHLDSTKLFKIVTIGDSGVGKSSVLQRWHTGQFSKTTSTINLELMAKTFVHKNDVIRFQLWDTAGQERFRAITNQYYRGATGVIIIFDLTSVRSFDSVSAWVQDVHNLGDNDAKCLLIGNKCDLVKQREVTEQQAMALAKKFGLNYIETSAKSDENIQKAFNIIMEEVYVGSTKAPIANSQTPTKGQSTKTPIGPTQPITLKADASSDSGPAGKPSKAAPSNDSGGCCG